MMAVESHLTAKPVIEPSLKKPKELGRSGSLHGCSSLGISGALCSVDLGVWGNSWSRWRISMQAATYNNYDRIN